MYPKRILHVVTNLAIGSGVMSVLMNYYRNINLDKIQFDFLYFIEKDFNYKDEILRLGGKVYFIEKPSMRTYHKYRNFFKEKASSYNVIHLHAAFLNSIILPLAKKNGIRHLITHAHATQYSDKKISTLRNKLLCLPINRIANWHFACSIAAGEFLYGKQFLNNESSVVINNAIDCKKFKFSERVRNNIRRELNLENKLVIGHIGRFAKQKNHNFLIDVYRKIVTQRRDTILLLIGDGPLFAEIKEKVKKLNLKDSVIFLGRRNNIHELLQAMDIFVLPSLFEGLPLVAVEAQASGLPIIMSDNITKEIGLTNYKYISLKETPKHWADEILSMDISSDRKRLNDIVIERGFDIRREAHKLEKLYEKMN